ncbi:Uncharacterised protein [Mycobacteroides abscessus subsp. abscessus]|nr:Uncharacterised protein [Mycobacteroides abscessus subsp. abscessus]
MDTQLRKKMRAKDSATTASMPAEPSATTACSREDPQPKLAPAITTVHGQAPVTGSTNGIASLGRPHMASLPSSAYPSGVDGFTLRYSAVRIWSVSRLSPST